MFWAIDGSSSTASGMSVYILYYYMQGIEEKIRSNILLFPSHFVVFLYQILDSKITATGTCLLS